jgi:hypothetical protein
MPCLMRPLMPFSCQTYPPILLPRYLVRNYITTQALFHVLSEVVPKDGGAQGGGMVGREVE